MQTVSTFKLILLLAAIVCFILAAFGVSFLNLALLPLGLAFFAGAFLVV